MQHSSFFFFSVFLLGLLTYSSCKSTSSSLSSVNASKSSSKNNTKNSSANNSTNNNKTNSTTKSNSSTKNTAEMSLRTNLVKEAEKYKGTKYKAAGKDPKGFDCSGFTYYVCSKYGIDLSSSSSSQSTQGTEIPITKVQVGDLLFFGPDGRKGRIQHVGMVYENNKEGLFMIHSSTKRGIVIDNVTTSAYWQPKLLFARRIVDLKD